MLASLQVYYSKGYETGNWLSEGSHRAEQAFRRAYCQGCSRLNPSSDWVAVNITTLNTQPGNMAAVING